MRNSKPRSLTLLRLLLMTLAMLFITPKAFADLDGSQFHKAYNYQINLSGTNSIKLKFPLWRRQPCLRIQEEVGTELQVARAVGQDKADGAALEEWYERRFESERQIHVFLV